MPNITLKNFQYFCQTENDLIMEWREEDWGEPTICKNDNTHTILSNSIRIASGGVMKPDVKEIKEESVPTGGHFQAFTVVLNAAANTTTIVDNSWKFDTSTLAVYYVSTAEHEDDEIEVIIGPDTKVGYITTDITSSENVIPVDSNSLNYLKIGYFVKLSTATIAADLDTSTTDELGEIIDIDHDNSTITVDIPTTNSFLGLSGQTPQTYIYMSVKMVKDYVIGPPWEYVLGESKIGASYLPKNTVVRISYKNNSPSTAKKMVFKIERLY